MTNPEFEAATALATIRAIKADLGIVESLCSAKQLDGYAIVRSKIIQWERDVQDTICIRAPRKDRKDA